MLWFPNSGQTRVFTNGSLIGELPGTSVVSSGTTNTYGSIVELISAATNVQDSWGINVTITADVAPGALATESCIDILIGGATDDVLISSLICGGAQRAPTINYFFPLHIPRGVRIAAQASSVITSKAFHVMVNLYGGGVPPFRVGRKVSTLGTKINNSRGVAITPTASGGAASVTQIVASTTEDYFCVMPGFQCSTDTTMTTGQMNIGIGIGAATEERVGTWWYGMNSGEEQFGPYPSVPIYDSIPSGSRLTMLASYSTTIDAAYDGLIYAVS